MSALLRGVVTSHMLFAGADAVSKQVVSNPSKQRTLQVATMLSVGADAIRKQVVNNRCPQKIYHSSVLSLKQVVSNPSH